MYFSYVVRKSKGDTTLGDTNVWDLYIMQSNECDNSDRAVRRSKFQMARLSSPFVNLHHRRNFFRWATKGHYIDEE